MEIFNLPEAEFLALYAGVVAGGLVLAWALRVGLRRPGGGGTEMPVLHPYEIATLAGGQAHAVNAAVAGLMQRGLLTLGQSNGKLFREGAVPADAHPLEQALLTLPPGTRIDRAPDCVVGQTRTSRSKVEGLGLTLTPARAAQARWAPVVVLGAVALFGLAKVLLERAEGRTPTSLILACVVPAAGAVLAWYKQPQRSRRGDRVLTRLREANAALDATARKGPDALPTPDLILAIGLFGVGVLAVGPLATLPRVLRRIGENTAEEGVPFGPALRETSDPDDGPAGWGWLVNESVPRLGEGVGWRPELALAIDRRAGLGFIELIAEDFRTGRLPPAVERLRERGTIVVPHGISLSLGGAEPPCPERLAAMARLARAVGAPLVSEHLSFVRAGGLESRHLLPLPRTRAALGVVVDNVRAAQDALPVPLALENVASLFEWPAPEMDESDFLCEVLERTGALLLLDVENVYANARNHGHDAVAFLERLPLDRLAYVHIAGGLELAGAYHDTHTCPVPEPVLSLLEELCARVDVPGVLLERDGHFPTEAELGAELDGIAAAVCRGAKRWEVRRVRV